MPREFHLKYICRENEIDNNLYYERKKKGNIKSAHNLHLDVQRYDRSGVAAFNYYRSSKLPQI